MNRNMAILFGVIAPTDSAFADDITVETTSSTSIVSRAEVVADFTSALEQVSALKGKDSGSSHDKAAAAETWGGRTPKYPR